MYFLIMERNRTTVLVFALIGLSIFSCTKHKKNKFCDQIPEITIETNKDSLRVGEIYEAKIYLSDTTCLYIVENETKERILPVIKVNGELVKIKEDYYIFKEKVTREKITYGDDLREWSCSIIFPHPRGLGSVEIDYRHSYVIKE